MDIKKVNISINGKIDTIFIHNIVAQLFIPNPNSLPFVNHKDGNKSNNDISNLEWCSAKYNSEHARKLGLIKILQGTQCTQAKLTVEDVIEIRKQYPVYGQLKKGVITKLAKKYKVSRRHYTKCNQV